MREWVFYWLLFLFQVRFDLHIYFSGQPLNQLSLMINVTKMLSISFHWHCFFPSSLLICTSLINCYYPSCHVWTYLVHSVQIHVCLVIVLRVTHDELVWSDNPHFTYIGGFHLHLLVFPFVYQFNSRIGVLVHSSFAND